MVKQLLCLAATVCLLHHHAAAQCCDSFRSDIVSFPGSESYESAQGSYFSSFDSDLQPACRVSPKNASDVSDIVNIARNGSCPFAVVAGGHMFWSGANNIQAPGFTIDLSALNVTTLSEDASKVSVGSGGKWVNTYRILDAHNVTTSGGRVANVGVGGFLTGGGITYLSYANGWGSDNMLNYEVVLANGSIVNANQSSAFDLYRVLKDGSTNFGIVTRFDLPTFPKSEILSAGWTYNLSDRQAVMNDFVEQVQSVQDHPDGVGVIVVEITNVTLAYSQGYWDQSLVPSGISGLTPLTQTATVYNVSALAEASVDQDFLVDGQRHQWFTFTFTLDAQFPVDVHDKALEVFAQNKTIVWNTSFQPLPRSMIAASSRNGGNPTNLNETDGDLCVLVLSTSWTDTADDADMNARITEIQTYAEDLATERGILHSFTYLNYADGSQNALASSLEDVDAVNAIREKYDPENFFGQYWRGGFKIPSQPTEDVVKRDLGEL